MVRRKRVPLNQLREAVNGLASGEDSIVLRSVGMALFAISASCGMASLTGILPTPFSILALSGLPDQVLSCPQEYWRGADVLGPRTIIAFVLEVLLFISSILCLRASDFHVWGVRLLKRDTSHKTAALPMALAVLGLAIFLSIVSHPRIYGAHVPGFALTIPALLSAGVIARFLGSRGMQLVDTTPSFGMSLVTVILSTAFVLLVSVILAANYGLMDFFPLFVDAHAPTTRIIGSFTIGCWIAAASIAGRYPEATLIEVEPQKEGGTVRVPIVTDNAVLGRIVLSFRETNRDRLLVLVEESQRGHTVFSKRDVSADIPLDGRPLDIFDLSVADALEHAEGTVPLVDRLGLLEGEVTWSFTFDGILPESNQPVRAESLHVFMNRIVENGCIEGEMQALVQRCQHKYVTEVKVSADRLLTEQQAVLAAIEIEATRDGPITIMSRADDDLTERIKSLRSRIKRLEAAQTEYRARMEKIDELVCNIDVAMPRLLREAWAKDMCPRDGRMDSRVVEDVDRMLVVADLDFRVNVGFGRSASVVGLEHNFRRMIEDSRKALADVETERAERARQGFEDKRAYDAREHEANVDIRIKLAENLSKPENVEILLNTQDGKKLITDVIGDRSVLPPQAPQDNKELPS
jgi:hypothetical protein